MQIPIHDFATDNNESIPFKYVSLGAPTKYDFSLPHRHNYYEIFFFSKGGGNHLIDFKNYPILDNSIHFVSPGQVHQIKRAGALGSIILFSRDFFYTDPDGKTLFDFPFLNNSQYPIMAAAKVEFDEFGPVLNQVKHETEEVQTVSTEILRSYLKVILLKCLQLFDTKCPDIRVKQGTTFNSFRQMVEKEYRMQRQPAHYALQLNITEKRLNEICKENSGENVSDYIKNRVLLEAKRLLTHTEHNIK